MFPILPFQTINSQWSVTFITSVLFSPSEYSRSSDASELEILNWISRTGTGVKTETYFASTSEPEEIQLLMVLHEEKREGHERAWQGMVNIEKEKKRSAT